MKLLYSFEHSSALNCVCHNLPSFNPLTFFVGYASVHLPLLYRCGSLLWPLSHLLIPGTFLAIDAIVLFEDMFLCHLKREMKWKLIAANWEVCCFYWLTLYREWYTALSTKNISLFSGLQERISVAGTCTKSYCSTIGACGLDQGLPSRTKALTVLFYFVKGDCHFWINLP